jgi:uncharacterized protein with von Willebrand factor type A (vWA) domain
MYYYRIDGKYIDNNFENFENIEKFNKNAKIPSEKQKAKMKVLAQENAKKQAKKEAEAEKNKESKSKSKSKSNKEAKEENASTSTAAGSACINDGSYNPFSLSNLSKYIKEKNTIQFYDKKNNTVTLSITKDNQICLDKLEKTVCLGNDRFSIKADPKRVADIERSDLVVPYRKIPYSPVFIKPKPKVSYRDPSKPSSKFMKKYGTGTY